MSAAASSSSKPDLATQLRAGMVKAMQEMVGHSIQAKKVGNFEKGTWYPDECVAALKSAKQEAKLAELYQKNAFASGIADIRYFSAPINERHWALISRSDVLPSQAIRGAIVGMNILSCGSAVVIAQYKALLDAIGEAKFNRIFKDCPVNLRYDDGDVEGDIQPIDHFIDFTQTAKTHDLGSMGNRPVLAGQSLQFNGFADYHLKHPFGMDRAYNAICLEATPQKQKFLAHGLPKEGVTEQELRASIVEGYNKDPDHYSRFRPSEHEDHRIKITQNGNDKYKSHKINIKTVQGLKSYEGYDRGSPRDFRTDLIAKIVEAPLAQVSMAFVKQHSGYKPAPPISARDFTLQSMMERVVIKS